MEEDQEDLSSHDPLHELTSKLVLEICNNYSLLSSSHDDLDLPIAHKKGVKTYTQHPMSNFVSYDSLSPSFHSFSVAVSSIYIPHSIPEALVQQK